MTVTASQRNRKTLLVVTSGVRKRVTREGGSKRKSRNKLSEFYWYFVSLGSASSHSNCLQFIPLNSVIFQSINESS